MNDSEAKLRELAAKPAHDGADAAKALLALPALLALLEAERRRVTELEAAHEPDWDDAIQQNDAAWEALGMADYDGEDTLAHHVSIVVARASRAEQDAVKSGMTVDSLAAQLTAAESALAGERGRVIEECAKAMCEYCALPPIEQQDLDKVEPVPYFREAGYICNVGEFSGGFVHKCNYLECLPCQASPIRALTVPDQEAKNAE